MAEGKFPSAQEYLRKWSQILVDELRNSAVKEMNVNKSKSTFGSSGDSQASPLVSGIKPRMKIFGTTVEAQILAPEEWYWLEHGRKPGKMPPEQPIVRWIIHRGFQLQDISKSRKRLIKKLGNKTVRKGLRQYSKEKKAKQLAYLIRRKIAKDGTRETKFYSNVVTLQLINDLRTTLKEKYKKDIRIDFITSFE